MGKPDGIILVGSCLQSDIDKAAEVKTEGSVIKRLWSIHVEIIFKYVTVNIYGYIQYSLRYWYVATTYVL